MYACVFVYHKLCESKDDVTLIISTSWSTPLSPGNRGCKNQRNNNSWQANNKEMTNCIIKPYETKTNLSKKQLSHHTACRPYVNCSSIFGGTKYEFWGTIISWANVRNIGLSFHLRDREQIKLRKPHQIIAVAIINNQSQTQTYQNFCTPEITKFKLMSVWIHLEGAFNGRSI